MHGHTGQPQVAGLAVQVFHPGQQRIHMIGDGIVHHIHHQGISRMVHLIPAVRHEVQQGIRGVNRIFCTGAQVIGLFGVIGVPELVSVPGLQTGRDAIFHTTIIRECKKWGNESTYS